MWISCKMCGEIVIGDTFEEVFEQFRSHLFDRHKLHIGDANIIARDLIRKVIKRFPDL